METYNPVIENQSKIVENQAHVIETLAPFFYVVLQNNPSIKCWEDFVNFIKANSLLATTHNRTQIGPDIIKMLQLYGEENCKALFSNCQLKLSTKLPPSL